jgi:hypothetical protein
MQRYQQLKIIPWAKICQQGTPRITHCNIRFTTETDPEGLAQDTNAHETGSAKEHAGYPNDWQTG